MIYNYNEGNINMKKRILVSLVIGVFVLLLGGFAILFLSCTQEGGETPAVGTLYIGGYTPGEPGTGYIYVVSAGTKDLITSIEIPEADVQPDWLTLSPDGKRLYFSYLDRVYIINTETNTYVKSIYVYTGTRGIAFTPDGTQAVVGAFNEIGLIDAVAESLVQFYDYGAGQHNAVAVHPTNSKFYAALDRGASPNRGRIGYGDIDLSNVPSFVDTFSDQVPFGIAISSDGNDLYVSEESNRIILNIITGDGSPSDNGEGINSGGGVYFDTIALTPDDSKLYISRRNESMVDYILTANPSTTSTIDYGGTDTRTMDVALSDDGSIVFVLARYTVDFVSNCKVILINTADNSVAGTIDVGEFEPLSVAYKKP
jgi:DNA-binding beta-propeller fold protein YncE